MTTLTFRISGQAMSTIEGSEISLDAVKYDGGSQGAQDALAALEGCRVAKAGRGISYVVTATPAGAETIGDYCRTVGSTWVEESEPDIRAEGRALLVVADRIRNLLEKEAAR